MPYSQGRNQEGTRTGPLMAGRTGFHRHARAPSSRIKRPVRASKKESSDL